MTHRRERVAHELRVRVAEIVGKRARDPRLELLAITDVEVSPDLTFARVFFRTPHDPEQVGAALERARSFIRRELGAGLTLRRVPELDFRWDGSLEHGDHVEEILADLAAGRSEEGDPEELAEEDDA